MAKIIKETEKNSSTPQLVGTTESTKNGEKEVVVEQLSMIKVAPPTEDTPPVEETAPAEDILLTKEGTARFEIENEEEDAGANSGKEVEEETEQALEVVQMVLTMTNNKRIDAELLERIMLQVVVDLEVLATNKDQLLVGVLEERTKGQKGTRPARCCLFFFSLFFVIL
ncbi:uncharacterized protein LOC116138932 [Pistacia vera]|uniref:uncharacterized protein LOC116138932 n=1 Tax=Pistacia vera TaxID=55513 RepID=UPI0012637D7C|nr:uncharacterized protein LOC116138932 [Pistacia vera]